MKTETAEKEREGEAVRPRGPPHFKIEKYMLLGFGCYYMTIYKTTVYLSTNLTTGFTVASCRYQRHKTNKSRLVLSSKMREDQRQRQATLHSETRGPEVIR